MYSNVYIYENYISYLAYKCGDFKQIYDSWDDPPSTLNVPFGHRTGSMADLIIANHV